MPSKFICFLALLLASPVFAMPIAQQLSEKNIHKLQPAGPDAIGGVGDWLLSNGKMCAVISDVKHESGFMAGGGALVDLYGCEAANDQWTFQHFLPNVDQHSTLTAQSITASASDGEASLTVVAEGHGFSLRSVYTMNAAERTQLQAKHIVRRSEQGKALNMLGLLVLHPHMSLTPFSISTSHPKYGLGFRYPSSSTDDLNSLVAAMVPADVHVLVGASKLGSVSYGVQMRRAQLFGSEGEPSPLPIFQQTGESYNFQGTLSEPPLVGGTGKLGFLEFAQSKLMDLEPGERIELEQTLFLGDRADVASVSNQIYSGPQLSGTVDGRNTVVDVFGKHGEPITSVRPNLLGEFSVVLPKGTNAVRLVVSETSMMTWYSHSQNRKSKPQQGEASGQIISQFKNRIKGQAESDFRNQINSPSRNYEFSFDGNALDVGKLSAAKPAELVIDNDMALRLTFIGLSGTPNPNFYSNGFNADFGGPNNPNIQAANYLNFAGTRSDPQQVSLTPGRYRVLASRGMEYGVSEKIVKLVPGSNPPLLVKPPKRELSSKGLMAADFHVHSAASFDSYISIDERLRGFVAQGGDVLVATEHNVLVNYKRDLARSGLRGVVKILSGLELTGMARTPAAPSTHGHLNVFPMRAKPQKFAGGLPPHEGKRLRELYKDLADEKSGRLFQLNHPRSIDPNSTDQDSNYFDHLNIGQSYNLKLPLSVKEHNSLTERDPRTGLRDLDFDLLEIANGPYFENYQRVRDDWFSLLNQGEKIVGSANSDTHGNNYLVAIPQSYVQLEKYSQAGFIQAVKQGKMFGTSGPLLDVKLSSESAVADMGDTITGSSFTLKVRARAASWVPVDELKVYVNGLVVAQLPIIKGELLELPLQFVEDSYVLVEVTGMASEKYSLLAPGFVPFAFSNPIWVKHAGKEAH